MQAPRSICVLAVVFAVAANTRAQSSRMSPEELKRMESYTHVPADVKAFAAEYVAAYNSRDLGRVMGLNVQEWHCVTPANKDVYEALNRAMTNDPITAGYTLMLMPVNEQNLKAFAQDTYFPVKPERELHIDWQYPNSVDSGQVVLYLVHRNGRWSTDQPCMTPKAIKDFRDDAPGRAKYKVMAAGIKQPLRGELLAMLARHQTGEAEERYKVATGCDMNTAARVMVALAGGMP